MLTAIDGEEALRRVYETHPDLVLLDIRMPRKDGATVAQQLRDDPRTRDIPVVFLTGLIRATEADQRGGRTGRNLYLAKPFDAAELLRMVDLATRSATPATASNAAGGCPEGRDPAPSFDLPARSRHHHLAPPRRK